MNHWHLDLEGILHRDITSRKYRIYPVLIFCQVTTIGEYIYIYMISIHHCIEDIFQ